ncbi:MAG: HlyD family efflux transporter periplasmic adaptor subunit [Acidobacteria bacterium]|nr:HlyD family efflux transporter periplasmic adaptor subunit [Acidobacteriota bacterium]
MKRPMIGLGILFVAAGAAAIYRGFDAKPAVQAAAAPKAGERPVVAPGRVEPLSEEVAVSAEIDGKLVAVRVEEGDTVRRGQVIAALSNADFAARVRLAEASVAERRAEVARLRAGSRAQEKREADSFIEEARAVLEQARSERERRRSLLERGAISRAEFETAEREFGVAQARLEAAWQRASLVHAGTRDEEIARAEADTATAEARAEEARALLAKTVVVSPISGVVLRKHKRAGESFSLQNATPIVTLGDTSRLRVRVDVDETDVARVAVGKRVVFRAGGYPGQEFHGTVARVGRILGKKNIRTDEPVERVDTKILETLVDLDAGTQLPVGLRVDAYIER